MCKGLFQNKYYARTHLSCTRSTQFATHENLEAFLGFGAVGCPVKNDVMSSSTLCRQRNGQSQNQQHQPQALSLKFKSPRDLNPNKAPSEERL